MKTLHLLAYLSFFLTLLFFLSHSTRHSFLPYTQVMFLCTKYAWLYTIQLLNGTKICSCRLLASSTSPNDYKHPTNCMVCFLLLDQVMKLQWVQALMESSVHACMYIEFQQACWWWIWLLKGYCFRHGNLYRTLASLRPPFWNVTSRWRGGGGGGGGGA